MDDNRLEGIDPELLQRVRESKRIAEELNGKLSREAYIQACQDRAAEARWLRSIGLDPRDSATEIVVTEPGTAGCMPRGK